MSSPVDPSWPPPSPDQRVEDTRPPPPQQDAPDFTAPAWLPPVPDQRAEAGYPARPLSPGSADPAAQSRPPTAGSVDHAFGSSSTPAAATAWPSSPAAPVGSGHRRWATWQIVAVTATVGIVAGGAFTFVVTRGNRTGHVATPPTVSTQPAVSPSPIPTAEQPTPPASPPEAVPSPSGGVTCGVNLKAPQVVVAAEQLPPYPGTGWTWDANPATFEGNYNPCAMLSTVLVTVEMATGSSPVTALMFHNGDYLGTATSESYGFTSLNTAQTTDDTVVLDYKVPGACNACPPAGVNSVRYQWQSDHVEMLDPPPPSP